MPIHFIFGWSKALVAVSCSLLLLLIVIMCTQSINEDDDHRLHNNHTGGVEPYVIDRGNRTYANLTSINNNNDSIVSTERSNPSSNLPNARRMKKMKCSNHTPRHRSYSNSDKTKHWKYNTSRQNDEFDERRRVYEPHPRNIEQIVIDSQQSHTVNMTKSKTNGSDHNLLSFDASLSLTQQLHQSTDSTLSTRATATIATTAKTSAKTTITPSMLPPEFDAYINGFNENRLQRSEDADHMHNVNCSQTIVDDDDEVILSRTERSAQLKLSDMKRKRIQRNQHGNLFEKRIERSANLSLSKATKRIQLLIKGRFLQMLPDGTVNGTHDDTSEHTILQRNTVNVGQIRLIGIATCLYLCMDACGNLYSTREFSTDCVFNERLEHNYNYYTSTHHSTPLRTYYIALNRLGSPRKTHLPSNKPLGKLSTYAKAFTLMVEEHQSEMVIGKRFGFNHVKHGLKYLCESGKELIELSAKQLIYPQCSSGSSNSMIGNISIENNDKHKHKHSTHMRHTKSPLNRNRMSSNANALVSNCTEKTPHKKKKPNHANHTEKISDDNIKKHAKKSNANKKHGKKLNHRTQNTNTVTTTIKAIIERNTDKSETIVPANDDDIGVTSTANFMLSNEQSTVTSDEDY